GINALSKEQLKTYMCLLFFVFTVIPTLANKDTFGTSLGYSTFWLAYLYVIGAYIKKYGWGDALKSSKAVLIYIGSVLLSWGIRIGSESITAALSGEPKTTNAFLNYISPTMVVAAVALFLTFKNAKIPPKPARIISAVAPAAFGVYLIHEHEAVRGHFISEKFVFLTELNTPMMVAGILASALIIFLVCLFIDWIRHKFFMLIRLKERLEKLEDKYIHYNIIK
ncbi:MAG: acyltransferase family protein, partial [Clostridia bacterium]|nr:acyltransferase family protein [Clostridia bacterium]